MLMFYDFKYKSEGNLKKIKFNKCLKNSLIDC